MKMFGHFLDECVDFEGGQIEDGEFVSFVAEGRREEDSFVVKVLLDFVEVVLRTGANSCTHNL